MLSGCGPEEPAVEVSQAQVNAWIDKPVTNTQHPLAPVEIIFHGTAGEFIQAYQVFINDQIVETGAPSQTGADTFDNLETITTSWTPEAPGEYTLSVRVLSDDNEWGQSAEALITVLGPTLPSPTGTITPTPTATPTITPTVPAGTVFSTPSVSTELFYYRFSDCVDRTPNTVTISVTASDPAGIVNVELYFRVKNKTSLEMSEWQSVVMHHDGSGVYSYTLDADQLAIFTGDKESWLHYQLIANNQDGLITSTEVYFNVTVKGCEP
jgi:hypothetical protein